MNFDQHIFLTFLKNHVPGLSVLILTWCMFPPFYQSFAVLVKKHRLKNEENTVTDDNPNSLWIDNDCRSIVAYDNGS